MELLNATKMVAGYTQGLRPDGRELLVVVVKGTFRLPGNGQTVELADEQLPLVAADLFTGEPGFSAPLYESDYAPEKPFCDVIVNGSAYAPGGKPAREVEVGVKVGRVAKAYRVVGDRTWQAGIGGIGQPISRENCRRVLIEGYQRQRIAASFELALLNPDEPLFEWRAPGGRQQEWLGLRKPRARSG
jgi:hypothetical protein